MVFGGLILVFSGRRRHMFRKASGLVLILLLVGATSANAQGLSTAGLKFDFSAATVNTTTPATRVTFDRDAAPMMRGDTPAWVPFVMGGLIANGGGGVFVGGGVVGENFMSNPQFQLQIEGGFGTAGGGCAFDSCNATQILIGAIFWYMFEEMTSGWQPYAGGGLMFSRVSWDFDEDLFGCGVIVDCDFDDTAVGIAVGGGIGKNKLAFEGLFGSFHGGGALIRVKYKFGGGA
jgi:hypothetical protein